MMEMTVDQAAQAVEGRLLAPQPDDTQRILADVVTDSRQVRPGSLFVAIAGEHVDGHDYVATAAQAGACAVLVDHAVDTGTATVPQIVVTDTVAALGQLAAANLRMRRERTEPFTIVGITGSVGKTTTKDLLKALLSRLGTVIAPVGSFNNEVGLPLTACRVGADTRFLVAEMGANHLGEIAGLTRIAPPDIAVVLKVGVAHLGEFGSVEHIAQAKGELVRGLVSDGVTVLNADDPRVAAMARLAPGKVIWFGIDHAQAHDDGQYMAADDITLDDAGHPCFALVDDGGVEARTVLGLPGSHNVMNALAAAAVAHWLGLPVPQIAGVLREVHTISPHRMAIGTVENGDGSFTLIDDSFNANPDSMKAGLRGLMAWHAQEAAQPYRVAVLGAMLELGEREGQAHRDIGAAAIGMGVDAVVAVGSPDDPHLAALAEDIARGAREADGADGRIVRCVPSAAEADLAIRGLNDDHPLMAVLLKGSHASGLSALAERWERSRES